MSTPDLIRSLVEAMASEPDRVSVRVHESGTRDTIIVQVSATDMPRVLGRRASVFTALQSLVRSSGHPDRLHGREYLCCPKLIEDPGTVQSPLPDGRGDPGDLSGDEMYNLTRMIHGVLEILLGSEKFTTAMSQSNGIVFVTVRCGIDNFRKARRVIDPIFGAISLGIGKSIIIDEGQ